MSRRALALTAVLIGVLPGCAVLGGAGDPPLDQVFHAVEIDGEAVPRLPDGRAPSLRLDRASTRASGFGGCNRITGSYLLDGEGLSFGMLASTRMACEESRSRIESSYVRALQSVTRWRRKGSALELLDASGQVRMRLEPAGRTDSPPAP